ncbi:Peptidase S10 serine carboxypeptidase [Macrophomina phaseolina MS6]|uniref:Peptidase S10 serine carboxypeptidase n=1 Tax=Macrophomina phaseolina (strain MS6) TaxID=1126212 RepID=K2RRU1_MACPH|nr:Peptidase S10 serine carboxypeptidase [Macrophomina phaseolina MS6]
MNGGPAAEYLNRPWVQERLGFANVSFELIDFELNNRWAQSKNVYVPTTSELTWLLDETNVRILFINGNNDIIVCVPDIPRSLSRAKVACRNTPGQLRMLDAQPWAHQIEFQGRPLRNWSYSEGVVDKESSEERSGQWKGDGRLSIFTVDEAGHMVPHDQSEAVEALVGSWIFDEWHRRRNK